jgi:hypothetical protein
LVLEHAAQEFEELLVAVRENVEAFKALEAATKVAQNATDRLTALLEKQNKQNKP